MGERMKGTMERLCEGTENEKGGKKRLLKHGS